MEDYSSPASTNQRSKKVRIACQRCRDRRIKCDGRLPACSKCAKAGVVCIDVHSRSGDRHIPRSDQAGSNPRLQWLESLVKDRLPDVDLESGPVNVLDHVENDDGQNDPRKRMREAVSDTETSTRKRARRMALDLGLLSLGINASQVQYLGSSSGSFFVSLLQGTDGASRNEPPEASHQGLSESYPASGSNIQDENELSEPHGGSSELLSVLKEFLPPRKQCNALLEHFFSHYHPDYPVLHRPSFENLVDGLYIYASGTDSQSQQYNGWPTNVAHFSYNDENARIHGTKVINIPIKTAAAQLFFVLSIAAHLHTRKHSFAVDPSKLHRQALNLAQSTLSNVSLPSLQLLILLVLQSFLTQQNGNTWITLHAAMAYAIDLGLHRDVTGSARFSEAAVQIRRRIFFCVYTLDRLISTAQGRPLGFQDDTLDLTLPPLLSTTPDTNSAQQDQAYLPYSIFRFQLITLISKIKYQFYRLRDASTPSAVPTMQADIMNQLDAWLTEATQSTENFSSSDRMRLQTKLKIDYHFAICLLYQPSQICMTPTRSSLQHCFDSAIQRIRLYDALYNQNNLYLSWPTTHGIFLAGATLVYCIWTSQELRSKVTVSSLAKDFRLCSNLLMLGSQWWPLAQRGRNSFDRLADSTIESLTKHVLPPTSSQGRLSDGDFSNLDDNSFFSANFQSPSTNIESILQNFLQNELPLSDTLDMFGATEFGQDSYNGQHDGLFDFDSIEPTLDFGRRF